MFEVRDAAGAVLAEELLVDAAVASAHRASAARERAGAPMRMTVVRARDGALLAVCGGSVPRERGGEPEMDEVRTQRKALFERAVTKAGGVTKLAAAIGRDYSGLYQARRLGTYSDSLTQALDAYLAEPGGDARRAAALGDTGESECYEAPAEGADEAAWAARPARQEATRPAPPEAEAPRAPAAPRAPHALRVPASAPADGAVTLRLERDDAARLYRLLAGSGEQALRLALADALLGAA